MNRWPFEAIRCGVFLVAVIFFWSAAGRGQDASVRYVYDDLNRLTAVVDQQGSAAVYTYDSVGNILRIDRVNADEIFGALGITLVRPSRGRVGQSVEIFGKGFSATPASNAVTFNGTPATVTEAAPNRLATTVPAGATTGPIRVTVSTATATSPSPFTVGGVIAVVPTTATLWVNGTVQFQATEDGTPTTDVTWAVNSITGGEAGIGTITTDGFYSAPARVPMDTTVTVTATQRDDRKASASALITIQQATAAITARLVSVLVTAADALTVNQSLTSRVSAFVGEPFTTLSTTGVSTTVADSLTTLGTAGNIATAYTPVITGVTPASVARGASNVTVTLAGSGFSGATQVRFLAPNGSVFAPDTAITVSDFSVGPDGTDLTATIAAGTAAILGDHVVQVTANGATSTAIGTGANRLSVTP